MSASKSVRSPTARSRKRITELSDHSSHDHSPDRAPDLTLDLTLDLTPDQPHAELSSPPPQPSANGQHALKERARKGLPAKRTPPAPRLLSAAIPDSYAREIALLEQISSLISPDLSLADFYRNVVEALSQAFDYQYVTIFIIEGEDLVLQHCVGYQGDYQFGVSRMPVTSGLMGRAVRTGKPIFVRDVTKDADFFAYDAQVTSEIAVPLFSQGQVVGVVNVEARTEKPLTRNDQHLLTKIGAFVSTGLERIHLFAALKESEERYRTLVDSLPGMVYRCRDDEMWTEEFTSAKTEQITGYPSSDFYHNAVRSYSEICHPADLEHIKRVTNEAVAQKKPYAIEYRILHADGTVRWVADHGQGVFDSKGTVRWLDGAIFDISERKRMEEAEKQSKEHNQALLQAIPDMLFLLNRDGVFVDYHSGYIDTSYVPPEVFLSRHYREVMPKEQAEIIDMAFRRALQSHRVEIAEYSLPTPEGNTFFEARLVTYGEGQVLAIIRNITDRKVAERMQNDGERQLSQFLEAVPISVVVINTKGELRFVNEVARQLLGELVTTPEGFRKYVVDAYPIHRTSDGKPYPLHELPPTVALMGDSAVADDIEVRLPDRRMLLELHANPIFNLKGEVEYVLSVFQNITDRKLAEATLAKRAADMAETSRLKDEFLANMSHELRTPLNSVLTLAESLRDDIFGPVNELQREALMNIDKSGRHLLGLINDILDVSKIESGQLRLRIDAVDVQAVCQNCIQMVRETARTKRIRLYQLFDDTVQIIEADERRLSQILINLLGNAVKFTPEGGSVGLEVNGDTENGVVRFSVRDTGIGIAPEDARKLFKPFVQVDSSLSRHFEGTGLGLALVSRLTEMHGGSVALESEVGKGSCFTVILPWNIIHTQRPVSKRASRSKATPMRRGPATAQSPLILIAEDNESGLMATQSYLLSQSYRVITARNGNEALHQATVHRPDLILLDIQMPDMDGLETTRLIRANPSLAKLPIIALTALAMPGDRERCIAAGVTDYYTKPISLRKLSQVIQQYLK